MEEIIEAVGDVRRQDRQIDEFGSATTGGGDFENCALVGFEFRRGEECNEVKEIECYPVNVTKTRSELSPHFDIIQSSQLVAPLLGALERNISWIFLALRWFFMA